MAALPSGSRSAAAAIPDVERLEAYGDKSLAIVETGDPDSAERFVIKGRDIIDALRLGEGGKLPLEVAQVHFALGEIRKLRSEAIVFVPVPANFAEVLERRCQGLLDAQSAYSDAMRSYGAHWAAMSGYRVGQLYQRLHEDVIHRRPPPERQQPREKAAFEGPCAFAIGSCSRRASMMEHTSCSASARARLARGSTAPARQVELEKASRAKSRPRRSSSTAKKSSKKPWTTSPKKSP
jgi:hypothetical protein